MSDGLRNLPFVFRLSRATMRTIRWNVALALGIKLSVMGLVMAGLGSMWAAVTADVGATLLVVLISLRLLRRP
jgi:Cd2+/Zn2+-exporting ATPase